MFFDRFYILLSLACCLSKQGLHCVGTVQKNRLANCRFTCKKDLMKTTIPRRTYKKKISLHDGVDFLATVWKNNKVVNLLPIYISSQSVDNIGWYDKRLKHKVDIFSPKIVQEYINKYGWSGFNQKLLRSLSCKSQKPQMASPPILLSIGLFRKRVETYGESSIAKNFPNKQLTSLGQLCTTIFQLIPNFVD